MEWFDPNTRYPDGGLRYLPPDNSHQRLRSESVPGAWQAPGDVAELFGRVYPDGAPESWTRFFSGEETTQEEQDKIRAELKGHASKPSDSGSLQDQELLRARERIERDLDAHSWIDTDPWKVIGMNASQLATAVSARAAAEMQKARADILFEQSRAKVRAEVSRANDLHLLWLLCEAIIKAPASFSDSYKHLLPAGIVRRIEWRRAEDTRRAEEARRTEEASRLRQIEESEREKIEQLAAIEAAPFDSLLEMLFGHNPESSILDSFRRREKLTAAQLEVLIDLKDTPDPVWRRRGYERLIGLGASVGIAVLTFEQIEELQAARLREAEEAKEREIAATLRWIEGASWPELCPEIISRGLVPGEWQTGLHNVTDVGRVHRLSQHLLDRAKLESGVNRRLCEVAAARVLSRNVGMPGAVGILG